MISGHYLKTHGFSLPRDYPSSFSQVSVAFSCQTFSFLSTEHRTHSAIHISRFPIHNPWPRPGNSRYGERKGGMQKQHKQEHDSQTMSRSPRRRLYPPACKPYGLEAEPEARAGQNPCPVKCEAYFTGAQSKIQNQFNPNSKIRNPKSKIQ